MSLTCHLFNILHIDRLWHQTEQTRDQIVDVTVVMEIIRKQRSVARVRHLEKL